MLPLIRSKTHELRMQGGTHLAQPDSYVLVELNS